MAVPSQVIGPTVSSGGQQGQVVDQEENLIEQMWAQARIAYQGHPVRTRSFEQLKADVEKLNCPGSAKCPLTSIDAIFFYSIYQSTDSQRHQLIKDGTPTTEKFRQVYNQVLNQVGSHEEEKMVVDDVKKPLENVAAPKQGAFSKIIRDRVKRPGAQEIRQQKTAVPPQSEIKPEQAEFKEEVAAQPPLKSLKRSAELLLQGTPQKKKFRSENHEQLRQEERNLRSQFDQLKTQNEQAKTDIKPGLDLVETERKQQALDTLREQLRQIHAQHSAVVEELNIRKSRESVFLKLKPITYKQQQPFANLSWDNFQKECAKYANLQDLPLESAIEKFYFHFVLLNTQQLEIMKQMIDHRSITSILTVNNCICDIINNRDVKDLSIFLKCSDLSLREVETFAQLAGIHGFEKFSQISQTLQAKKPPGKPEQQVLSDANTILETMKSWPVEVQQLFLNKILTSCYGNSPEFIHNLNQIPHHYSFYIKLTELQQNTYLEYLKWKGFIAIEEIALFFEEVTRKYNPTNFSRLCAETIKQNHVAKNKQEAIDHSDYRFRSEGITKSSILIDNDTGILWEGLAIALQSQCVLIEQFSDNDRDTECSFQYLFPDSHPFTKTAQTYLFSYAEKNSQMPTQFLGWRGLEVGLRKIDKKIKIIHCFPLKRKTN